MKTFHFVLTTGGGNYTIDVVSNDAKNAFHQCLFKLSYAFPINTITAVTMTTL